MAQVSCSFCHHSPLMGTLSLIDPSMKVQPKKLHRKAWDPSPIAPHGDQSPDQSRTLGEHGNLRGEDIEKISQVEGITSSIKRINAMRIS